VSKPVLYGSDRSSCTNRVRIALALKGVEHDYERIDIFAGQHQQPDYLAINPHGQVPSLAIDGHRLAQSVAICEYLEQTRPDPPLLPPDAGDRARCRWIVEIVNAGIQPLQNRAVLMHIVERYGDDDLRGVIPGTNTPVRPQAEVWPQFWIRRGFAALEAVLAETARSCCMGDEITLADVTLFPQVTLARHFEIDLDPYPTIRRVDDTLARHPAFAQVRALAAARG
jgi:maleylacetoacetate isomerase